jgi:hypothetical protein
MVFVLNTENVSVEKTNNNKFKLRLSLKIFGLILLLGLLGTVSAYFYGSKVIEGFTATFVSHTEYWLDDWGNIIVRLTDFKGDAITGATCNASLIYQDDTYVWRNQTMSASTLAGNYYYQFWINSSTYQLGVYTKQVDCYVGNKKATITTTLHLNPALEYLKTLNTTGLGEKIDAINQTVTNIYDDTEYIKANMLNQTSIDNLEIVMNSRFDAVDGNMTILMNYCGNTETNSSVLCQKLYEINNFQQATNVTYTAYFENIQNVTTDTFNYMTGTLATNVNNIYNLLVGVNQTTSNIQENVTAMRQDQLDEINIVIIS